MLLKVDWGRTKDSGSPRALFDASQRLLEEERRIVGLITGSSIPAWHPISSER